MTLTMLTNIVKRWAPTLIWAGLIYYLSDQPNLRISSNTLLDFFVRKGAHMFFFGALYFLIAYALQWRRNTLAIFLAVAYAISDEIHQRFVPFRSGSPTDIVFDVVGIFVVSGILWKLQPHLMTKPEKSVK